MRYTSCLKIIFKSKSITSYVVADCLKSVSPYIGSTNLRLCSLCIALATYCSAWVNVVFHLMLIVNKSGRVSHIRPFFGRNERPTKIISELFESSEKTVPKQKKC